MSTDLTAAEVAKATGKTRAASQARWGVEEQDTGLLVAQGSAPSSDQAVTEAMHYATQYAQDGAVRFWVRQGRKTVMQGSLACACFGIKPC